MTGIAGYANPLAGAQVTPERIDQGVDYAGTGVYDAIGSGTITYAGSGAATGWPGVGGFIEELLNSGPFKGSSIYYAEGVIPTVKTGQTVAAGQEVAALSPNQSTGTEIGFGSGVGTQTYAAAHGEGPNHNIPSAAGIEASKLIAALGGAPGKLESAGVQGTAPALNVGASINSPSATAGPATPSGITSSVASDVTGAVGSWFSGLWSSIVGDAKYGVLVLVAIVGGFVLMGKGISRATHAGAS